MSRTPLTTVAVFHGDGNLTLYRPGSDGVTVDESVVGLYNGWVDVSLEFQSFGTSHLRHTVPLRDTLEVLGLPDPYTPAALEVAWENAEQSGICDAGDVLITRLLNEAGGFKIAPARSRGRIYSEVTRILSRAPQREPWQDLADDLRAHTGEPDPDETARMLHEQGWRKGGGES